MMIAWLALAAAACKSGGGGNGGSGGTGTGTSSGGSGGIDNDPCGPDGALPCGGSGGTGGTGGGASCFECACVRTTSDVPPGCADACDKNISGAPNDNFCNGAPALSTCEGCIQLRCGQPSASCE